MKFKSLLILSCAVSAVYAYTQSDLLAVQYAYQTSSEKVTDAKNEKFDASAALAKAKDKLTKAQQELQQAQGKLQAAQTRFKNSESNLLLQNKNFAATNQKLEQIWNSLNPATKSAN